MIELISEAGSTTPKVYKSQEWLLIAGVLLVDVALVYFQGMTISGYKEAILVFAITFAVIIFSRSRGIYAIPNIMEIFLLWSCFAFVNAISSYATVQWKFPLRDAELSYLDSLLKLNRSHIIQMIAAHPYLETMLKRSHKTLFYQAILSSIFFSFTNRDLMSYLLQPPFRVL
jgi:hypothetical protein